MLPFLDLMVIVEVNGKQIHEILEACIADYPQLSGFFPCVSGIAFKFNPNKEKLSRIDKAKLFVNEKPVDYEKKYSLATNYFFTK